MSGHEWAWEPNGYLDAIRAEIPLYDRLQDAVAAQCLGDAVTTVLELGIGSGETARRILAIHPNARLVGIDASEAMLDGARRLLAPVEVELRLQRLEDELPTGPFDLVVSVLTVHHLDAPGKADLFRRVHGVTSKGGRFVLGDLVVPRRAEDGVTPADGVYDRPSGVDDQVEWLRAAGFEALIAWERLDLAVLVGIRE